MDTCIGKDFHRTKLSTPEGLPEREGALSRCVQDEVLNRCIACDSEQMQFWCTKAGPDGTLFSVFVCGRCGTGFLNPRPTDQRLKCIYQFSGHGLKASVSLEQVLQAERDYPNSTVDARRLVTVASRLAGSRTGGKALDVGSGFGFFSRAAMEAGFEVTAINPGRWENDVFERLNGFRPLEAYIQDVGLTGPFDLVIMSQVLEHIPDASAVLSRIRPWLRQGGVLAVAVPNFSSILVKMLGRREQGCLWVPEHVNYFTKRGLCQLFARSGFSVVRHQQVTRIPYHCVSRRLNLTGRTRAVCNLSVRCLQTIPDWALNQVGWGLYLNVWATVKA